MSFAPTRKQQDLASEALETKAFIYGPAGAGKSSVGVLHLQLLLERGVTGRSILVLAPQRTLHEPYLRFLDSPANPQGTQVDLATVGGLARRMCELFWPLIAEVAGFAHPDRPPFFLTLESAQYYMAHIVRPLLDRGYFQSVTMDRNRLYAQILDSLNKAAAVGFPHSEIALRLESAWVGEQSQRRIYAEAQDCASHFREFCLQHNLLDFSLQLELLATVLLPAPFTRDYLGQLYHHVIYDNVEEDVPRAHEILGELLGGMDSALLIYDQDAGYRRFLGADTDTGWALSQQCESTTAFHESHVMPAALARAATSVEAAIRDPEAEPSPAHSSASNEALVTEWIGARFYPELVDRVTDRIQALLVEGGVTPGSIAVLAPYLSDALRFAFLNRLAARSIPARTLRPSRTLRNEAAARAILALSAIAHPHWNVIPPVYDVARAFMTVLSTDLIRANLLANIVYRKGLVLAPFAEILPEAQSRITPAVGERYAQLRNWLLTYRAQFPLPLDYFIRKLFGELLSQPGYGFHNRLDDAAIAGSLVDSIRKFRQAMEPSFVDRDHPDFDVGREYMQLLEEGVLAALHLEAGPRRHPDAVIIAPAHSFLMTNSPVGHQFWLDPGASGWYERLDQPLTHTRVLSRDWPLGRKWTFTEEEAANRDTMARLVTGLLRRCSERVYICASQLSESGFEQRGPLLQALIRGLQPSP